MGGSTKILRQCFSKTTAKNGGIVQKRTRKKITKKRGFLTNKPLFFVSSRLYPYINSAMFSFEGDW